MKILFGCFCALVICIYSTDAAMSYDLCYPQGRCVNLKADSSCDGFLFKKSRAELLQICTNPEMHAYCCKSCFVKLTQSEPAVSGKAAFCKKPASEWMTIMKDCKNQNKPNALWCQNAAKIGMCKLADNNCWHFRLIVAHGCLSSCNNDTSVAGTNAYCP